MESRTEERNKKYIDFHITIFLQAKFSKKNIYTTAQLSTCGTQIHLSFIKLNRKKQFKDIFIDAPFLPFNKTLRKAKIKYYKTKWYITD